MRITIRLDEQLLKSARHLAHHTGKSLTAVIEDGLRQILSRPTVKQPCKPVTLTTVSGHGIRSGVDVDDSASLLTFMEKRLAEAPLRSEWMNLQGFSFRRESQYTIKRQKSYGHRQMIAQIHG